MATSIPVRFPSSAPGPRRPGRRPRREDIAFMPTRDAIEGPRVFAHILLFAIILFFAAFLYWANWATLDEVTHGTGKVIPSRQIQIVQNLEGGIILDMLVHEGDIVEKGQILLRIDNIRAASDYGEARSRYLALLAAITRLTAEVDETDLTFPPEVMSEAPSVATRELELFHASLDELESELEILRQQASQRGQELAEQEVREEQLRGSYELALEELSITRPLAEQRVISQLQLLQLERQVNDLKGEADQTRLSLPRIESALNEAHKRIAEHILSFRTDNLRQLNELKSQLAGVKEEIAEGQDRVRRTGVRSPVRGTVKEVHHNTIGGVVQPGADLIEIVPLEDTLLIEAQIRPADIAFIRPSLPATVKITAYDFSIYGGLDGVVENISADTIVDEQGESFYRVRVRTERNYLGTDANPLTIIPGMTAQVDVLTGEKTVLDYLLKPILKARNLALRER